MLGRTADTERGRDSTCNGCMQLYRWYRNNPCRAEGYVLDRTIREESLSFVREMIDTDVDVQVKL